LKELGWHSGGEVILRDKAMNPNQELIRKWQMRPQPPR
jgi:hypothetical protein